MSLNDYTQLFFIIAGSCLALVGVFLVGGGDKPSAYGPLFLDLLSRSKRAPYSEDYRDKRIVAGGLIGIMLKLIIVAVFSAGIGVMLWLWEKIV